MKLFLDPDNHVSKWLQYLESDGERNSLPNDQALTIGPLAGFAASLATPDGSDAKGGFKALISRTRDIRRAQQTVDQWLKPKPDGNPGSRGP